MARGPQLKGVSSLALTATCNRCSRQAPAPVKGDGIALNLVTFGHFEVLPPQGWTVVVYGIELQIWCDQCHETRLAPLEAEAEAH